MLHQKKISNNLQEAQLQISQNSIDGLNIAIRSIEKIESYNSSYAELLNNLKSTYYELQENNRDISAYMDELDFNPEEQKQIEDRYDFLYNLKRKYGNSIEEILDYRDVQQKEIEKIENLDNYILELKQEQKELITKMRDLANSINSIRQKYAKILSTQINKGIIRFGNAKCRVLCKRWKA